MTAPAEITRMACDLAVPGRTELLRKAGRITYGIAFAAVRYI